MLQFIHDCVPVNQLFMHTGGIKPSLDSHLAASKGSIRFFLVHASCGLSFSLVSLMKNKSFVKRNEVSRSS